MIFPSVLAIVVPILIGVIFGVPGVIGLLTGGLSAGFVLAIFMANAGGAWDNAKKYVEEGNFGGNRDGRSDRGMVTLLKFLLIIRNLSDEWRLTYSLSPFIIVLILISLR